MVSTERQAGDEPLVSLRGIGKTYLLAGGVPFTALADVTLEVGRGSFTVVVGPSGSGKSTLLHILGGLLTPTTGEYRFEGRPVAGLSPAELARFRNRYVGFVFQRFNLLPDARVWENVALPLVYRGVARGARRARALELLERFGLRDKAEQYPAQLSAGQEQRVAICRALAGDPQLILADEPTGNVDRAAGKVIMEELLQAARRGKAVVLVTHDLALVEYADHLVEISDGRIVRDERVGVR
ncbi:MAG: ABC transporter ATP-binding protein [Clostridia bacterium]|nr:ABC transporter ATP-binding protein [Clostridia bacterium]